MTFRTGDEIVGLRDKYRDGTHGTKAGDYILGLLEGFADSQRDGKIGRVLINAVVIGDAPPNYKNQGYYVAGSVLEEWVTVGLPSTFPPSAHTLADCQHLVLET